jgi:hypothetical protein
MKKENIVHIASNSSIRRLTKTIRKRIRGLIDDRKTHPFLRESFLMFYIYQYLYRQYSLDKSYLLVYLLFFVVVPDLFVLPILYKQNHQIFLLLSHHQISEINVNNKSHKYKRKISYAYMCVSGCLFSRLRSKSARKK